MNAGMPKRVKRDWPAVFDEFRRSGQTIKEFCMAKGMSQSLFYRRRKDHSGGCQSAMSSLRRSDFIELQPTSASRWSAAIAFGSQIELSIANDCDHELLRLLISQLKGSPC